jgi:TPR repeat protein
MYFSFVCFFFIFLSLSYKANRVIFSFQESATKKTKEKRTTTTTGVCMSYPWSHLESSVAEISQHVLDGAVRGDADAQFTLAQYFHNRGFASVQDLDIAASWYLKAAGQGHAASQYCMGNCCARGDGVIQDYAAASGWFQNAAASGASDASDASDASVCGADTVSASYCSLGAIYHGGLGCARDYERAAEFFVMGAKRGHGLSLLNLALCYFSGHGVVQDHVMAIALFLESAALGNAVAMRMVGSCCLQGLGCDADAGDAVQWFKMAVAHGDHLALAHLSHCVPLIRETTRLSGVSFAS